jgi:methionyl-tRNA formyltransferase
LALEEGIPVMAPDKPRGDAFLRELTELAPDISVVVAYGHILKPEVLELPPLGSINVHASLLPALRGAAPIPWAILRGLETTGVTIMRMVEGMDAGPILFQTEEEIGPEETASELATRLSELGAEALVEALALLEEGLAEEVEQEHALATFAPKLDRETARVDWLRPARELEWHLRGMDEEPGAWSVLRGEAVKLFRPLAEPSRVHYDAPGSILEVGTGADLLVACGSGALRVAEIHPPGGKRMPVAAWLRGHPLSAGDRFE